MKTSIQLRRPATSLFLAIVSLATFAKAGAQTTFVATTINSTGGGEANPNDIGTLYSVSGPTTNNLTGQTIGDPFGFVAINNFVPDDVSFDIGGNIGGSAIAAGTALPISYNFTLSQNFPAGINWSLKFTDSIDNPGGGLASSALIASGSLTSPSGTFSGSGTYTFSNAVSLGNISAGATYSAELEFTFSQPGGVFNSQLNATMNNTGFGGEGITLNASSVPEPSTYAAIAGVLMLGFAAWHRRRSAA